MLFRSYKKWKSSLHISGTEKWYHVFTILRTYLIVNFCWFFDRSDSLSQGLYMIKCACTHFNPAQILDIPAGRQGTEFVPYALLIIAVFSVIMVLCGILQEHGKDPYEKIRTLPLPAVFAVYVILFLLIGFFGSTAAPKGFIYAQF